MKLFIKIEIFRSKNSIATFYVVAVTLVRTLSRGPGTNSCNNNAEFDMDSFEWKAAVNFQLLLMAPSTSLQKHLLTEIAKLKFQNQKSVDFINELVIKIVSQRYTFSIVSFC